MRKDEDARSTTAALIHHSHRYILRYVSHPGADSIVRINRSVLNAEKVAPGSKEMHLSSTVLEHSQLRLPLIFLDIRHHSVHASLCNLSVLCWCARTASHSTDDLSIHNKRDASSHVHKFAIVAVI